MFTPSTRQWLAAAALALSLAALCFAPPALARVVYNTIDNAATLTHDGRHITITGPIANSQIERVDLRVTITQRTTGALAEGRLRFFGTTTLQHWTLDADVIGDADFEEGPAVAVAVAVTSRHGRTTDAHQWLVPIQLQPE